MEKFQRFGQILSPMEYNSISEISLSDIEASLEQWRKVVPKPFKRLLLAVPAPSSNRL